MIEEYVYGLPQDSAFRTNVGIVNFNPTPHTFALEAWAKNQPARWTVTVQRCSMTQTPVPAGDYDPLMVRIIPLSPTPTLWTAYGRTTDNVTGDGWAANPIF